MNSPYPFPMELVRLELLCDGESEAASRRVGAMVCDGVEARDLSDYDREAHVAALDAWLFYSALSSLVTSFNLRVAIALGVEITPGH